MHDFANVRVRLERFGQRLPRLQVARPSARRHDQDTLHAYGREWTEEGQDSSGPFGPQLSVFRLRTRLRRTRRFSVFGFRFELLDLARTRKRVLGLRSRFISLVRLAALTNDAEVSYVNKRPEKLTGKSNRIAPKSEI
jgi:hypothetical protein